MFAMRHYGYGFAPQSLAGDLYGMGGAACLLALLALTPIWWPVKAWMMAEEFLTFGCTAAWLAWPDAFRHAFAGERCSQAVGMKLSSIGLVVVAFLALRLITRQEERK